MTTTTLQSKTMATTANTTTGKGRGNTDWSERELGCLWRREKQGTKERYLTGVLDAEKLRKALAAQSGDIQLIIFSNKSKTKETHPDLRIYLSDKKPNGGTAAKGGKAVSSAPTPPAPAPTPDANELI